MDRHRRELELKVDDLVWVRTDHLPHQTGSRKLAARWAGPFKVTKLLGKAAARVELPGNLKLHPVFHFSQLKPHHGGPVAAGQAPVYPVEDAEDAEYEVEAILQMRLR